MDGPNMWHFSSVFQSVFLNRGEKVQDISAIDEARLRDLEKYSDLQGMIDKELKKNFDRFGIARKAKFSRRVQYTIDSCEFSFTNQNEKFATGNIDLIKGMHQIYQNRESKTDIDID